MGLVHKISERASGALMATGVTGAPGVQDCVEQIPIFLSFCLFFFLLRHTTIWDFFLPDKDKIIFLFSFSPTC